MKCWYYRSTAQRSIETEINFNTIQYAKSLDNNLNKQYKTVDTTYRQHGSITYRVFSLLETLKLETMLSVEKQNLSENNIKFRPAIGF